MSSDKTDVERVMQRQAAMDKRIGSLETSIENLEKSLHSLIKVFGDYVSNNGIDRASRE